MNRLKRVRHTGLFGDNVFVNTVKGHVKLAIISASLLLLSVLTFGGLLLKSSAHAIEDSSANIVIINYDHEQRVVPTTIPTVGALLNKLNIKINSGDVVEPALSTNINQSEFRINIYRARPVEIVDGVHKIFTFSASASPRTVAQQAGLSLYPEDYLIRMPVTNFVSDGAIGDQIIVDRATPITLRLYGHATTVRTHAKTVNDLMSQEGIVLASGDTLTPGANTPLVSGLEVDVNHQGTEYTTTTEAIPAPVQYVPDASLSIGTSAVRQTGSDGERQVTYQITLKNGEEVGRTQVQSVITVQPVPSVVARGTAIVPIAGSHIDWMNQAGISATDQPYADYIISHESGWCPTKWQGQIGYCPSTFEPIHSLNSGYGYGLGQSTPAINMASFGSDWQTNPITQLKWANAYAQSHWDGWYNAFMNWQSNRNW